MSGQRHHRRGIDGLATGVAAHLRGRSRLLIQMEHGLDARYVGFYWQGGGAPAIPPQPSDVRPDLRVHRELRVAALARRGRARQALAVRQDARRRMAEARQLTSPVLLPVDVSRQEALVHGRRARATWRMESP